jgi:hypothetical protein
MICPENERTISYRMTEEALSEIRKTNRNRRPKVRTSGSAPAPLQNAQPQRKLVRPRALFVPPSGPRTVPRNPGFQLMANHDLRSEEWKTAPSF